MSPYCRKEDDEVSRLADTQGLAPMLTKPLGIPSPALGPLASAGPAEGTQLPFPVATGQQEVLTVPCVPSLPGAL